MKFSLLKISVAAVFLVLAITTADAQYYRSLKGDPFERKKHVHSGNQIRTTFFNYGLIGRVNAAEDFGGEWPINSGHFYVGDISVMVGADINLPSGRRITPMTVADGPRGSNEVDPTDPTVFWGWEPLPGFANPDTNVVAMSHVLNSWPDSWPDRENDMTDPGWPKQWNGFFGKDQFNADQESYWVMDDSRDREWIPDGFFPDTTDLDRGGLALISSVRGLQWSQTLAQNTIFWLYDVTNIGTTDYDKAVFGMIVGTTIGGDGDTDDDNSRFDAVEDLTYSWDNDNIGNTGWSPVGYLGYAFLESPGNRLNGIDDDSDETGAGSVIEPAVFQNRTVQVNDDVVLIDYDDPAFPRDVVAFPAGGITFTAGDSTYNFQPGSELIEVAFNNIDDNLNGLIDEYTEIPNNGIDDDNNGLVDEENPQIGLRYINYLAGETIGTYPLIDEGRDDGIDNDGDWRIDFDDVGLDGKAGTNDFGEGDGMPTSGYQPGAGGLLEDTGLPGEPNIDKTDIDESDQIGLTSFFFFTPFNLVRLFNDSQLWQELSPGRFNDAQQNVDGDFIYGTAYFPMRAGQTERISLAFFFGDNEVEIFRTKRIVQQIYNNDYNFAKAPILPIVEAFAGDKEVRLYWDDASESSFDRISLESTGNGFDFEGYKVYRATFPTWEENGVVTSVFGNRVADVPIAQFDQVNSDSGFFPVVDPSSGATFYLGDNTSLKHTFVDNTVKNGFTYFYAVTAYDRGVNANDLILQPAETSKFAALTQGGKVELGRNVVVVRPEAPAPGIVPAAVDQLAQVSGDGNGEVFVEVIDPLAIRDGNSYEISFSDTNFLSTTYGFSVVNTTTGETLVDNKTALDVDATVFEGLKLIIRNGGFLRDGVREALPRKNLLSWEDTTRGTLPIVEFDRFFSGVNRGVRYPANYKVEVGDPGVGMTSAVRFGVVMPTNFRVLNASENRYVKFDMVDLGGDAPEDRGILDQEDIVVIYEPNGSQDVLTWFFEMGDDAAAPLPQNGDVATLPVNKPFLSYDRFSFTARGAEESAAKAATELDKIRVVPNPYIATASWEPRNNFSSGRGDRAIHFINLPQECNIRIYNIKGELVSSIEHRSTVTNGTADWDLLSLDQLDVSYGVYIYHVEAPGIGEYIGKFAVIK